jgi:tetratricopeptide (TPR) repeat protein
MKKKPTKPLNQIERYEQYLSDDPLNVISLTTLGNLYHQDNQLSKAITCFTQCLDIDTKNPIAKICLAKTFITAKHYLSAEKILTELVDQEHVDDSILQNLGLSLYFQHRWDEAFLAFERSGFQHSLSLTYACYCLHHQQQYGKALCYTKNLIALNDTEENQSYLALLEADNNHFTVAKKRALSVLQTLPNETNANLTVALCLIDRHEYHQALPYLEKASLGNNKHLRAVFYIALYDLFKKRPRLAIQSLQSITNNKANLTVYLMLGWAKLVTNDYTSANDYFYKALSVNPNSVDVYGALVIAMTLSGNKDEADKYLQKTKSINDKHFCIMAFTHITQSKEIGINDFLNTGSTGYPLLNSHQLIVYLRDLITKHTKGLPFQAPHSASTPRVGKRIRVPKTEMSI